MSDLIDRQALLDECLNHYEVGNIEQNCTMDWICKTVRNFPAASPWHRVEDELPKFGEYVLAWEIQGFAVVDKYVGIGDGRWDLENVGAIYTHWMPLPEPPKEEEHGN